MNRKALQQQLLNCIIKPDRYWKTKCLSYLRTKQKFYENASIREDEGKFYIQLDGKNVKTPLRKDLFAPTRKLAMSVVSEWSSQKQTIMPHQMHMTALCNTCIDNPRNLTKDETVDEALSFLHSDTLCARTPAEESEWTARMLNDKWDPVIRWFNKRFGVDVQSSDNIIGFEQPTATVITMREYLSKLNKWQLAGLQFSIDSVKSLIIPFAVIEQHKTLEEALYLSRLEIHLQIEKWGNVEWHHDVENENQMAHLSAGILFYQLSSNISHEKLEDDNS